VKPWAILQFPGSNCDADALKAIRAHTQVAVRYHWYSEPVQVGQYDVVLLPGGFSFGDYLRTGAIAKISPAMRSLPAAIEAGTHALGICNGFQILLEARLLPGVLKVNHHLKFVSRSVDCRIDAEVFPWFRSDDCGKNLRLPVAHGYGNFQAPKMDLAEAQVALRYQENPNGSLDSIAGIYRRLGQGSVMGLMPHPERASFADLRLQDGSLFWTNAQRALT
jgi:phosphoribosylformylglycinamidine synthase subunit PurQ / glutaminase